MHTEPGPFAAFVEEHFDSVVRCLTVGLRQPRLAREAAEDAFAGAYARRARRNGTEPTAISLYVDATRRALRRMDTEAVGPLTTEPDTVTRAVEDLPTRERLALVLHHRAPLSRDALARALRCSPLEASATLRAAYHRLGVDHDDDDDIPEVELDGP